MEKCTPKWVGYNGPMAGQLTVTANAGGSTGEPQVGGSYHDTTTTRTGRRRGSGTGCPHHPELA